MNIITTALLLLAPFTQAADSCGLPVMRAPVTYDCRLEGATARVTVRETGRRERTIMAEVSFRVTDLRTGKTLEAGTETEAFRHCRVRREGGNLTTLRQYGFGRYGNGSNFGYNLSDNDGDIRELWVNSTKVNAQGIFPCVRR